MRNFTELDAILTEQPSVKLTDSFSFSFNDFKRQAGSYLGFTFLIFVASIIISFIPFGSLIISPFLALGFATFLYFERVNHGVEFGNFFKSFDKFGNVILTYLLTLAAYFIAILPLLFLGGIALFKQISEARYNPRSFDPVLGTGLIAQSLLPTTPIFIM
jgi:hypothetical protein